MVAPAPRDTAWLLRKYTPVLRFDSRERYFADSAAIWTDHQGNELRRADGTVIAAATPQPGQAQLSLDFLGRTTYADGSKTDRDDFISAPGRDYAEQAAALHAQTRYADRIYGHATTGSDGRLWLQYWTFYFYNDYDILGRFLRGGLHEGDWEMVQIQLGPDAVTPELAVYAQHRGAAARAWGEVEKVGERPVVYPARGSHAAYFTRGLHWTGYWFDHANGRGAAPDLTLEVATDEPAWGWMLWPGSWGDTTPAKGRFANPLSDRSPRGPASHGQWHDPAHLLERVRGGAAGTR